MITNIIVWYLIGVILAYPVLLIGNTIEVKINKGGEEDKLELYYVFLSFILIFLLVLFILNILFKKIIKFKIIKEIFNKKPDLIIRKK